MEQNQVIPAKIRKLKKAAVLGSGVMGSRIACHLANAGLEVVLLDIPSPDENAKDKNDWVNQHLKAAVKSNPSPLYLSRFQHRIKTGNFEENMEMIAEADWIIEAVIEDLNIKKDLFAKVEAHRKKGTLISTNTSGIPIQFLLEDRSEDFQQHFCGTHFFNPPRYLELLEIIPSVKTDEEVLSFFENYAGKFLGKTAVRCKDTPAFIANRVGVFSIMAIFKLMQEMNLSVEQVDAITGPISGRPKSATFRTCDVVGNDTLVKVANGVAENCPKDERIDIFKTPAFLDKMLENKMFGDKTGKGFYRKTKDEEGNRIIEALNLNTLNYQPKEKVRFESLGAARKIDDLKERLLFLSKQSDVAATFLKRLNAQIFSYVSHRIPEIADYPYQIDDAIKAGFGWKIGPFELWDLIGLDKGKEWVAEEGLTTAHWVAGVSDGFYQLKSGERKTFVPSTKTYTVPATQAGLVQLDSLRGNPPVWKNKGCTLHDIGDGVLCLEFHTKMNAIGGEILNGIKQAINISETQGWNGLVIGNEGENFSAGANIGLILMYALEQEYDELNMAINQFQSTMMRVRYSSVPVVVATHALTLGGGCELTMHSDAAIASAETYIGLVEFGVGVIPGGGGTKEFTLRAADEFVSGGPEIPALQNRFTTIATANVATSAHQGFEIGVFDAKKDRVVMEAKRRITEAKNEVLYLANRGYAQPIQRTDIKVLGKTALGALYSGVEAFYLGAYATEHDKKIARKLAYVMAGGDLSQPQMVSEKYLLDLEREAFLSLCGEKKTLQRMQAMLKTGKPLRN